MNKFHEALISAWDTPDGMIPTQEVCIKIAIHAKVNVFLESQEHRRSVILPSMPRLYTIMRNDLESLNAGKAVAQGQHAANQVIHAAMGSDDGIRDVARVWSEQTPHGFGTSIVLAGRIGDIGRTIREFDGTGAGVLSGITHDPTYPLKDGEVIHLLPLDTCGFILGFPSEVQPHLRQYALMP